MLRAAVSNRALLSSLRGPSLPASQGAHMATRSVSSSVTRATAGGAGAPTNVRLVTYNVLSSHLGGADHFRNCAPADLAPATRLTRLLAKLELEVSQGSLLCLQEVSMTWSGPLISFFNKYGYTFVSHLYGTPFNNYMGVGIAFPHGRFAADAVDLSRVSDGLPRPPRPPKKTRFTAFLEKVQRVKRAVTGYTPPPQDEWTFARGRFNTLVFTRLRDIHTEGVLCLACYHMPCAFNSPKVMTIHAGLVAQKALKLAAGAPLVLAGDFNFKPLDPQYRLMVSGSMDAQDAAYPQPQPGCEAWRPTLPAALRSAYAEANGAEPDCTNYAQVRDEAAFIDTLDYIFVSAGVQVLTADLLPHRSAINGPLPASTEPSDHLLLAATLRV